jgi:hypothetical protein
VIAYVAIRGFSDPLSGAIADSVLARTVKDLQDKRADLNNQNQKLKQENGQLNERILQGQSQEGTLKAQIEDAQSNLNRTLKALATQKAEAQDLEGQIKSLSLTKDKVQEKLEEVNSQLSTARKEVVEQLRSILVYQAAFLASEIYDKRFFDSLYQSTSPGVLVARTTPILAGGDKCFDQYIQSATFTWWSLISCISATDKFPWPADPAEKQRVNDDLLKWKEGCSKLTREFVITPRAGQDHSKDSGVSEILEFRTYELSSEKSLQNAFCT